MEKFSLDLSNKLVGVNVVFVTGEGCASCVGMVDVVNQVSKKIKNVNFYILNVEESYLSFLENYTSLSSSIVWQIRTISYTKRIL